jgi:hypothetical protein
MRIAHEQQHHELRKAYLIREVKTTQTSEAVDVHALTANPRITAIP